MITRSLLRWTTVVVIALAALGAIGLALGGVPLARATGATHIYPSPGCGPTLADCIAAVPPGDVIQIKAGIYTESVALNKGVSLIGQGWATTELRAEPRKRVLTIDGSTNPITESTVISGLMLSNGQAPGAACPDGCGGGILITGTARPALQYLMLDDNQAAFQGGGLWVDAGLAMNLNAVQFISNVTNYAGGGLYAGTQMTLTNVTMIGNLANFGQGGGVYGDLLSVIGGKYRNNSAQGSGGAIYAQSLSLSDAHVTGNYAASDGGGAFAYGLVELQNGRFENNLSNGLGGGLYAGDLIGQGTWFVGNQAQGGLGEGGGAYVGFPQLAKLSQFGTGTADLQHIFFVNNVSTYSGGGLFALNTVTLTDAALLNNTAGISNTFGVVGGGLYGGSNVNLIRGLYQGNSAVSGAGGGIYALGPLTMWNVTVQANDATNGGVVSGGGGVYANAPASIVGGSFGGNTAGFWPGGGLYAASGGSITGTFFLGNLAGGGGGVHSAGILNLTEVTMRSNQVISAGVSTGGAVESTANVTVSGGVYDGNWAERSGGAFSVSGVLYVSGAQVTNNYVTANRGQGGAIYSSFQTTIDHSRLADNLASNGYGGGLYSTGPLTVAQSLFIGNNALDGGALYQATSGDARVVNSLFASNQMSLTFQGAALSFNMLGSAEVAHDTIVDGGALPNPGVAINVMGSASANVRDTIVGRHQIGILATGGVAVEDYNLYYDNLTDWVNVVTGTHSVYGQIPNFSNPLLNDYHLRIGSPGTGQGISLPDVPDDIDGQVRPLGSSQPDIGYDEVGATIQQMIDNARPGDTIYVPAGAYTDSLTLDRPVNLVGAGSDTNAPTVIHAVLGSRVLTVTGQIDRLTRIADLQLVGGNIAGPCPTFCGGGVLVTGGANPTFDNVAVEFNQAAFGGGLYLDGSGALLLNSRVMNNVATQSGGGVYVAPIPTASLLEQHGGIIANNQAVDGAGVFVQGGLYQLYSTTIVNNSAQRWGGGLLVADPGARAELYNSNVISNSASAASQDKGGGIFVDQGQVLLDKTLVMSNTSVQGGGMFISGTLSARADVVGGSFIGNAAMQSGGGLYALNSYGITGTRFFQNSAGADSAVLSQAGGFGRVVNAFVADNQPGSVVPSIMTFGGSAKAQVFHTTFGNSGAPRGYAVTVVGGGQVTVIDTIVATYTRGLYNAGGGVAVEDYNLYAGNTADFAGTLVNGTHSLHGPNPIFVNPAAEDFHIRGFSPAVNRGTDVGVRRDIDLDPRPLGGGFDIGADEASVAGTKADPLIGGSFTYTTAQNSTINMILPPGAVTETTPLYCSLLDNTTAQPPHGLMFAGVVFELDAQTDPNADPASISFNTPVTLSVSYTDQQLFTAGITDEQQLKLYRFEPSVNQWEPIGFRAGETQTLDVANKVITATILSFSRFGSMAPASTYEVFLPLILRNF